MEFILIDGIFLNDVQSIDVDESTILLKDQFVTV